ncbi:unnamed protein product [Mycena citricolor]|uniref:Uncharacterized protein n=1 Tax=Mycena citricolor TaxID=2018698 RepID=A0AAD2GUF7_9AGAR|nr:unnamed protein product [Mycena citricolor]
MTPAALQCRSVQLRLLSLLLDTISPALLTTRGMSSISTRS